jgi:hypothetical protein
MSFNMFSDVSTEGGMNDKPEFKPLPDGSYIIQFSESTKRQWDGIPQLSFRFNVPFKVNDESDNGKMFEPIKEVTNRENFALFSSFKIFNPIEFDNIELGFTHNEKPLRALLMLAKSLTAYETDEEVQELLQIPVTPTFHKSTNGVTNSDDIVDGYVSLFNSILVDTACKADVVKFKSKTGKVYNNIRWYKPLVDMEVKILEFGESISPTGMAVSDVDDKSDFNDQQKSATIPSNPVIGEETDDDIPF